MFGLLGAHHCNIGCGARYRRGLTVPDRWITSSCGCSSCYGLGISGLDRGWFCSQGLSVLGYLRLRTEDVRAFAGEATKVLCDVICPCKARVRLPLDQLLLLLFGLSIHHTNLEVLLPIAPIDLLLAVWALLSPFSLLLRSLSTLRIFSIGRLSHIVLDYFHVGIECRPTLWQAHFFCDLDLVNWRFLFFLSLLISPFFFISRTAKLIRIWHLAQLLILSHVLLDLLLDGRISASLLLCTGYRSIHLLCHLLVVVEIDLLDDDEVEPVHILSHLAVLYLVAPSFIFHLLDLLLVGLVQLSGLSCPSGLLDTQVLVSITLKFLQHFTLWHQNATVGLNQSCKVAE